MNKRKFFFTAIIAMSSCIFFGHINAMHEKQQVAAQHDQAERFQCKHCGRIFKQLRYFKNHELTHLRKFPCRVCGELYTYSWLQRHQRKCSSEVKGLSALLQKISQPHAIPAQISYAPFSSPEVHKAALSLRALWPSPEALSQSIREFSSRPMAQPSHSIDEFYTADDDDTVDAHGEELLDSLQQKSVGLWPMYEEFPEAPTPSLPAFSSPEAIAAIEALAELSREGN